MDWQDIIKTVAPWIGTALGGPLGGMAVTAAASALGLSTQTTDALKTAITGATPEQMLALKQADQAFQAQMTSLGFKQVTDLETIAAGDRSSARELLKTTRSWVPAALTAGVTFGFFAILILIILRPATAENQAANIMLGSLGTAWTGCMAFWFGTTVDSGRKTELMAAQLPGTTK